MSGLRTQTLHSSLSDGDCWSLRPRPVPEGILLVKTAIATWRACNGEMHRFGSGTFVATGWERSGQERAPRGRRGPAPPTPFGPPSTRSRPITLWPSAWAPQGSAVQWSRVAWLHVQGGLDAGRGTNSTQTPPAFSGVANHALVWGTLPWSSSLYVDLTLDARRKRKLPVYRGLALYLVEVNVADVSDDSSVHKDCWGFERLRTISSKLGVTCREARLVAGRLHPSGDAARKGHCYSTQVKNRPPLERNNYMSPDQPVNDSSC